MLTVCLMKAKKDKDYSLIDNKKGILTMPLFFKEVFLSARERLVLSIELTMH